MLIQCEMSKVTLLVNHSVLIKLENWIFLVFVSRYGKQSIIYSNNFSGSFCIVMVYCRVYRRFFPDISFVTNPAGWFINSQIFSNTQGTTSDNCHGTCAIERKSLLLISAHTNRVVYKILIWSQLTPEESSARVSWTLNTWKRAVTKCREFHKCSYHLLRPRSIRIYSVCLVQQDPGQERDTSRPRMILASFQEVFRLLLNLHIRSQFSMCRIAYAGNRSGSPLRME